VENVRTSCIRRRPGHPDTADQLGLTDIQRRDPLDNLLLVLLDVHPSHLLESATNNGRPPVGAARETANLVLVLEATMKGPQRSSQRPSS